MRAQQIAAEVLSSEISRLTQRDMEPLVMRTMLWILENYSLYIFENGEFSAQRLEQCRRTMIGIAESVVLGADATPACWSGRPPEALFRLAEPQRHAVAFADLQIARPVLFPSRKVGGRVQTPAGCSVSSAGLALMLALASSSKPAFSACSITYASVM